MDPGIDTIYGGGMSASAITAATLILRGSDCELEIDAATGGSVRAFRWNGLDIFRGQTKAGVLESACFPLVPFCNRIADSRFNHYGSAIILAPNHPALPQEPVLHGFGWLAEWRVEQCDASRATLIFDYVASGWPWRFFARQNFILDADGLLIELTLTNLAAQPMPAGLGFHPYFPRSQHSIVKASHRGERQADGTLRFQSQAMDWWQGNPVDTRIVDTTYVERCGNIRILWPDRDLGAELVPGPGLTSTHIFVPREADYFCVEPVSHLPEAFTTADEAKGWRLVPPGKTMKANLRVRPYALSQSETNVAASGHA